MITDGGENPFNENRSVAISFLADYISLSFFSLRDDITIIIIATSFGVLSKRLTCACGMPARVLCVYVCVRADAATAQNRSFIFIVSIFYETYYRVTSPSPH